MNSLSSAFPLTTAKPAVAISDATFLYIPFSIHAVSQSPKTQKKPALKQRSSKPNKNISSAPVLTPSTAPSPSIPRKKLPGSLAPMTHECIQAAKGDESWNWHFSVLVPIGFGTEEMEAVIMIDILRRAGADVTLASVEEQLEVEASGGIRLVADTFISSCSDEIFDLVALPGGMPGSARLRDCKILQDITSKHAENKRLYGAICAAPAIALLPWGLLKRKQTTCHPAFMDKLPTFWAVKSNVQVSGELTTSRGPGTCFDFAVSLVEQLFGKSVAMDVSDSMLLNADVDDPKEEEFNDVSWALDHTPQILVPVANGSEETEVVTIVDILRRAKANVIIASVEKSLQTLASSGTKIIADKMISAAAESTYDLIILPGGVSGDERLQKSRILKELLKEQDSTGRFFGAVCSSLAILQGYGLLRGRQAAAYPSLMSNHNEVGTGARVVIDGHLITSKGLATATDFALAIVSKLFGQARARSVAEGLVFKYPR